LEERRTEVRAPSAEEVRALIAAAGADDLRVGAFLRVLAATGMRRGEACSLRCDDLNLVNGIIAVDEGVVTAKGGAIVKGPKTRASVRKLACDDRTAAAFRTLRAEQERLAAAGGDASRLPTAGRGRGTHTTRRSPPRIGRHPPARSRSPTSGLRPPAETVPIPG